MTDSSASKVAIIWSVVVVLLLGVLMVFTIALQPRFYRSPDKAAPSDQDWYSNVFDPAKRVAIPDLLSHPILPTKVESVPGSRGGGEDTNVSFEGRYPKFPSENLLYEIFPSDSTGIVTLPDGNRLNISAVAIALPTDTEWEGEETPPEKIPDWRDPYTGESLSFSPGDPLWSQKRAVSAVRPKLHFRVQVEGDAPIRWLIPSVHDAQTKRSVGAVSGPVYKGEGFFSMDLEIWHQTALDVGVEFYFGDPEVQTLPVKKGAEIRFGNNAIVQVKDVFPAGYRFVSWVGGGSRYMFHSKPPKEIQMGMALQVWPPCNTQLIDYEIVGTKEPHRVYGSYGLVGYRFPKGMKNVSEIQLRRYPRLGRAKFHLTTIPRLPEVSNLFASPISKIRIKYPGNLASHAADAAEVKYDRSISSSDLPKSKFPMILTDTTPAKIFVQIEEMSGQTLYFDSNEMEVTARKPPGLLERVRDWIQNRLRKWAP